MTSKRAIRKRLGAKKGDQAIDGPGTAGSAPQIRGVGAHIGAPVVQPRHRFLWRPAPAVLNSHENSGEDGGSGL